MSSRRLLMVFARNPSPGRVKSRLAESMGEKRALEIYCRLLDHTRHVALEVEADRQVWFTRATNELEHWPEEDFERRLQRGDGLGSRMQNAFRAAFRSGYGRVVVIGSDCADLRGKHLRRAFRELRKRPVVLGPSADGGYYLLGTDRFLPSLFRGIEWGTDKVFDRTLEAARTSGMQVGRLPELNDVDTESDWADARERNDFLQ